MAALITESFSTHCPIMQLAEPNPSVFALVILLPCLPCPPGRYIATSVTSVHQMENGFNIWSFQGKLLYVTAKERLFQFSWRPRLPSLLSAEKEAEIVKNLKAYSKKYDEEDEQLLLQADADVLQERQRMLDEWTSYTTRRAEYVQLVDGFRRTMYGERFAEGAFKMETTTVEQVVDIKEEPYKA